MTRRLPDPANARLRRLAEATLHLCRVGDLPR